MSIEDNFGNIIRVGDYVFASVNHHKIVRVKVSKVTPRGIKTGQRFCHIDSIVKDNTQELDYLHSEYVKLKNIEALYLSKAEEANDGWDSK